MGNTASICPFCGQCKLPDAIRTVHQRISPLDRIFYAEINLASDYLLQTHAYCPIHVRSRHGYTALFSSRHGWLGSGP